MEKNFIDKEFSAFSYKGNEQYTKGQLNELNVAEHPMTQFKSWFDEVLEHSVLTDPNALSLSTVEADGCPRSRIVLLKEFSMEGFVFYTNYESKKGKAIDKNPKASLHFFWPDLERQVIIKAILQKVPEAQSDQYFAERPRGSQIGAHVSPQSSIIPNRDFLEKLYLKTEYQFTNQSIPRPNNWGGYLAKPYEIEFWQGRLNRLHDRIIYKLKDEGVWEIGRLAP